MPQHGTKRTIINQYANSVLSVLQSQMEKFRVHLVPIRRPAAFSILLLRHQIAVVDQQIVRWTTLSRPRYLANTVRLTAARKSRAQPADTHSEIDGRGNCATSTANASHQILVSSWSNPYWPCAGLVLAVASFHFATDFAALQATEYPPDMSQRTMA